MKKTILILVALALLAPATALAATEFSLGGFIKLSSVWDSTQNGFQATVPVQRNNDQLFHHGRFNMTAQESRFNFTIKGPNLWGATTTGFIEMDFDSSSDGRVSNTASYIPRLRHAMFKLNWPETELMFGQYFGMFSEFSPEVTGDSQYSFHGFVNQRVPQIRLTQKFAGAWTVAGAILKPYDPATTVDATFDGSTNPTAGQFQSASVGLPGQSSETPQVQAKLAYEQDLWGKAPFYGRPRGFVAQVTGGWQRTRYRADQSGAAGIAFSTFGQNVYGTQTGFQTSQQNLDPWMVQGTLFIPVLPTYSNNLAGSASLTAQWFLGQGVSFVGGGQDSDNSWFDFQGIRNVNGATQFCYSRQLTQQFGGYMQGQYWFTNEWFMNLTWGMIRNYGQDTGTSALLAGQAANPVGYKYANVNDQVKLWSEYTLTLWYRPVEAFKFGLQYAYESTGFLQKLNNPQLANGAAGAVPPAQTAGQPSAGAKDVGESHRVQFVAIMFF